MICTFVFQNKFIEKEGAQEIPDTLKNEGYSVVVVDGLNLDSLSGALSECKSHPVVVIGSIAFCRHASRTLSVTPGVYYSDERFRCSHYMPLIGAEYLLNPAPVWVPGSMLRYSFEYYLGLLGVSEVFIRPDAGSKVFPGQVIKLSSWEAEFNSLDRLSGLTDQTLVMISPVKKIDAEYRFVIVAGKVVCGSQYMAHGELDVSPLVDEDCLKLAEKIAQCSYQVDTAYTCDVALSEGVSKVVELNAFSTSGLYACDRMAAYRAVASAAVLEFEGDLTL